MERRKRVEMIMNSRLFREELERIFETQMKEGGAGPGGLLQQLSDMMGHGGPRFQTSSMFRSEFSLCFSPSLPLSPFLPLSIYPPCFISKRALDIRQVQTVLSLLMIFEAWKQWVTLKERRYCAASCQPSTDSWTCMDGRKESTTTSL